MADELSSRMWSSLSKLVNGELVCNMAEKYKPTDFEREMFIDWIIITWRLIAQALIWTDQIDAQTYGQVLQVITIPLWPKFETGLKAYK